MEEKQKKDCFQHSSIIRFLIEKACLEHFYMKVVSTKQITGIASWLSGGQTFVAVFSRFRRASWFALNAVQSIADPRRSAPSEPRLNA